MKIIRYNGQSAVQLFGEREEFLSDIEGAVKLIIENVKKRGDEAVKEYSAKFDGYLGDSLEVSAEEIEEGINSLSPEYMRTLETCIDNIKKFHKMQLVSGFKIEENGRITGQKVTPVTRAGIYVPGGTAAYPSTVLMNAVPAKIAGVEEVVMVTPVKSGGKVKAEVLAAAKLCGVDRIFKVGGAQAIAALAYGTESIPKADKITGPGNAYVATAKKLVSGVACGIDMIAGPSEILVLADGGANPAHIAADLLSQAEHDKLASAVLITDSEKLALAVIDELEKQLKNLPRYEIASASIESNCKIILTDDLYAAVEISNEYAPEHLELCVSRPFELLERVKNAGSVFLGYNTPEAVGDYYAGANHTLPTNGTARFASPLGVNDFMKVTQYVCYDKAALSAAAADIAAFAKSEGLDAHAESVNIRVKK